MRMVYNRRKSFAQPAWTGKKVDNTESGRQITLLTNFAQRVYTNCSSEDQEACDRYR